MSRKSTLEVCDPHEMAVRAFLELWAEAEHWRGDWRDQIAGARLGAEHVACSVGEFQHGRLISAASSLSPAPYRRVERETWVRLSTKLVLEELGF